MLQWPWRFELRADSAHRAVEKDAVPRPRAVGPTERDEKRNRAAERLGVEEGRQGRRVTVAKGVEKRNTVVDDGVNIRNVVLKAVGESMALMIDGAGDESGLSEMHGSQLNKPARFSGEAMDDGDDSDWFDRSVRDPPLSEELKASGIGDEFRSVSD